MPNNVCWMDKQNNLCKVTTFFSLILVTHYLCCYFVY